MAWHSGVTPFPLDAGADLAPASANNEGRKHDDANRVTSRVKRLGVVGLTLQPHWSSPEPHPAGADFLGFDSVDDCEIRWEDEAS